MSRGDNDFRKPTITQLAQRVGWLCSNPDCQKPTIGPKMGEDGVVKVGEAAHITAASPGGARYDPSLKPEERRDFSNGIWLCRDHAHQVDHDEEHFTVEMLRKWKKDAENRAFNQLATGGLARTVNLGAELAEDLNEIASALALPKGEDLAQIQQKLRQAASKHLNAFETVPEWPVHAVELSLEAQFSRDYPAVFGVDQLASILRAAGEISIVASPGTGKSTTLVQLGTRLNDGGPVPILIPLAEWAYDGGNVFAWAANRNAFLGARQEHLKFLAHHGELALLLDGWNELEGEGRKKLLNQLKGLRRDYPLLLICMSTRQQAREVPLRGPQIRIRPLSEQQQLVIARTLKGDSGEKVLDHAWRTSGLRDLVTIPLYLSVLLEVSNENSLPETKEEILRRFVEKHESVPERAEILDQELHGQHSKILAGLAVEATCAANTTITEAKAFAVVKTIEDCLVEEGQLASTHQPKMVLEVLVNTHTLERSSSAGVSFQHQQFQEWYASQQVERQMIDAHRNGLSLTSEFAVDVLNNPAWEEAVLFAVERLSRQDQEGIEAVATTVSICLQIDPMFAAAILARSAEDVWKAVSEAVQSFAQKWHQQGEVDRGLGFMIATGRPEFASDVWPFVTSSDAQVQYSALRVGSDFKIAVLGEHLNGNLSALSDDVRARLLTELVYCGDTRALDLVTDIASRDVSADVQTEVICALLFRLAERQAVNLLRSAGDDVWKQVAARGYASAISDEQSAARLKTIQTELIDAVNHPERALSLLVEMEPIPHDQITEVLADPKFDFKAGHVGWSIARAQERAPAAVAEAMRKRIISGQPLPWRPGELLANVPSQDDGPVVEIVLSAKADPARQQEAAQIVGPRTVTAMIVECIQRRREIDALDRPANEAEYGRLRSQQTLIALTRSSAFFEAICGFKDEQNIDVIAELARLVARHGSDPNEHELSLEAGLRAKVITVLIQWSDNLLSSRLATRHHFHEVVRAMKRLPDPTLVRPIRLMLQEDLWRWYAARQAWLKNRRGGSVPAEVSTSYTWTYRDALAAIGTREVENLLIGYLKDAEFSEEAATGLRLIWDAAHRIREEDTKPFRPWPDLDLALANRARREANPAETADAAEAIFSAVTEIISCDPDERQFAKAVTLAGIAVTMPHGDKQELLMGLVAADIPARAKLNLLTRMVVGGLVVQADSLMDGLQQLLAEAESQSWLLGDENANVFKWIELFPFSDAPLKTLDAIDMAQSRLGVMRPWHLRGLLRAVGKMPGDEVNEILSSLAEKVAGLVREYDWYRSLLLQWRTGSLELLESVAAGTYGASSDINHGGHQLASEVAAKVKETPSGEKKLVEHFKQASTASQKAFLGTVIIEIGSQTSFLKLAKDPVGRAVANRHLQRALEELSFQKHPIGENGNTYELVPIDASMLRKELFALAISEESKVASFATQCMEIIDNLRDEFGGIDTEPRHPDILTGRPWPALK